MSFAQPRVTIALPVYNGEDFLPEALQDLLSQDFTDFELIISDNASTDGTPAIIADAAAADRRVRIIRRVNNIGAGRNFEAMIPFAERPYFMYAAHDDRWDRSYLRRMVKTLDERPEAVLACADSAVIDEFSNKTGKVYPSAHSVGYDLAGRIRILISQFAWVEFYGLMRSSALRAIGKFGKHPGGDVVFLAEMSILGEIATVPEPLFFYRMPTGKITDHAYYAALSPSTPQDPQTYTALIRYLFAAVCRAKVPSESRAAVRNAFIEQIGVPSGEWFAAIAAERRIDPNTVSLAQAQAIVAALLTEAERMTGLPAP